VALERSSLKFCVGTEEVWCALFRWREDEKWTWGLIPKSRKQFWRERSAPGTVNLPRARFEERWTGCTYVLIHVWRDVQGGAAPLFNSLCLSLLLESLLEREKQNRAKLSY